jgi:excisionase family DNA binding protein
MAVIRMPDATRPTSNRRGTGGATITSKSSLQSESSNPDVLTLVQAAQYLKCHTKTLRILATKGKIPGRRVGSLWRFYRPSLEEWMRGAA